MGEKTQKQKVGGFGEDEAVQYLIKKGYKIVERNHRQKWGEIDIITISPDKILVFVEVKAIIASQKSGIHPVRGPLGHSGHAAVASERLTSNGIQPEDNLTWAKLKKLQRTCQLYANSHENLVNERGWQIDLVAIDVFESKCDFRHYENI